MTGKITSIILCNYPFFTSSLADLQSNWNTLEEIIDDNLTEEVYINCMSISFLTDLFLPPNTEKAVKETVHLNFETLKNTFKENLKVLFAKTNKTLIKIVQNYKEAERKKIFPMFSKTLGNAIANLSTVSEIVEYCQKSFSPLYLMMTSARANIWKDSKRNVPLILNSKNERISNQNMQNEVIATTVFMNSCFQYHGDYSQSGGKCFKVEPTITFGIWDCETFTEPDRSGTVNITVSSEVSNKRYVNPTAFISAMLLNFQDPNLNDYSVAPMISADYFTTDDISSFAEEYRRQSDRPWLTFADILIGFDENDTYSNQTFKRLIYNAIMRKLCNWTLFIPLNTFFDCSNINKVHKDNGISITPSQLGKFDNLKINDAKLSVANLETLTKELIKKATTPQILGKELNINCMQMSNPPTIEEIARYNAIQNRMK